MRRQHRQNHTGTNYHHSGIKDYDAAAGNNSAGDNFKQQLTRYNHPCPADNHTGYTHNNSSACDHDTNIIFNNRYHDNIPSCIHNNAIDFTTPNCHTDSYRQQPGRAMGRPMVKFPGRVRQ